MPDILNSTFHLVDTKLSELAAAGGTHSGCTAVVAFLRLEDDAGDAVGAGGGVGSCVAVTAPGTVPQADGGEDEGIKSRLEEGASKLKELLGGKGKEEEKKEEPSPEVPAVQVQGPADVKKAAKRTLYTANVGDARAVLSCAFRSPFQSFRGGSLKVFLCLRL